MWRRRSERARRRWRPRRRHRRPCHVSNAPPAFSSRPTRRPVVCTTRSTPPRSPSSRSPSPRNIPIRRPSRQRVANAPPRATSSVSNAAVASANHVSSRERFLNVGCVTTRACVLQTLSSTTCHVCVVSRASTTIVRNRTRVRRAPMTLAAAARAEDWRAGAASQLWPPFCRACCATGRCVAANVRSRPPTLVTLARAVDVPPGRTLRPLKRDCWTLAPTSKCITATVSELMLVLVYVLGAVVVASAPRLTTNTAATAAAREQVTRCERHEVKWNEGSGVRWAANSEQCLLLLWCSDMKDGVTRWRRLDGRTWNVRRLLLRERERECSEVKRREAAARVYECSWWWCVMVVVHGTPGESWLAERARRRPPSPRASVGDLRPPVNGGYLVRAGPALIVVTVSERYLRCRCVIRGQSTQCRLVSYTRATHDCRTCTYSIVFKTLLIYFFVNKTNYCTQLYLQLLYTRASWDGVDMQVRVARRGDVPPRAPHWPLPVNKLHPNSTTSVGRTISLIAASPTSTLHASLSHTYKSRVSVSVSLSHHYKFPCFSPAFIYSCVCHQTLVPRESQRGQRRRSAVVPVGRRGVHMIDSPVLSSPAHRINY